MRNRRCKAKWLRSIKRRKGNSNRRYPTFYQHCNFRGYKKSLTRSTNWVRRVRIKNDDLSSIVVPRGWVVTVYQHAHYKGKKMTIVGPKKVSCLVRNKMNRHRTWNDQISSIAVHRRGRRKRRRRSRRGYHHLAPGNVVALKGGRSGKYCADEGHRIVCNRGWIRGWERFTVVRAGRHHIALRGGRHRRMCADEGNRIRCNRGWVRSWEKFRVVRAGRHHVALRGGRGHKYCADDAHGVRCNRSWIRGWEKFKVVVVKRARRRL